MIPDQASVTYIGTWQTDRWTSPNDTVSRVLAALQNDGLSPRDQVVDVPLAVYLPLTPISFNVHLTLQVENGMGFSKPDDIISIVRHEVLQITGAYPTSDSVPYVVAPGSTKQTPTGQPAPAPAPDATKTIGDWLKGLGTTAMWILGVVLVIAIAGTAFLTMAEKKVGLE